MKQNPFLISYKNQLKIYEKLEAINLIEEKRKMLQDIGIGNHYLNKSPKSMEIQLKMNKWEGF